MDDRKQAKLARTYNEDARRAMIEGLALEDRKKSGVMLRRVIDFCRKAEEAAPKGAAYLRDVARARAERARLLLTAI